VDRALDLWHSIDFTVPYKIFNFISKPASIALQIIGHKYNYLWITPMFKTLLFKLASSQTYQLLLAPNVCPPAPSFYGRNDMRNHHQYT
jgi:hypothetical protein